MTATVDGMVTLARRLFWIALLSGAGYAVYTAWQRRSEPMPDGPAEWPPFDDTPADDISTAAAAVAPLPDLGDTPETAPLPDVSHIAESTTPNVVATPWVEPTDGQCPIDHPIKGNSNSGIYHVPGGRFYDRTVPERCYATEDDAVADGYRRAKA